MSPECISTLERDLSYDLYSTTAKVGGNPFYRGALLLASINSDIAVVPVMSEDTENKDSERVEVRVRGKGSEILNAFTADKRYAVLAAVYDPFTDSPPRMDEIEWTEYTKRKLKAMLLLNRSMVYYNQSLEEEERKNKLKSERLLEKSNDLWDRGAEVVDGDISDVFSTPLLEQLVAEIVRDIEKL